MAAPVKVKQIVVSDKLCKACYLCIWACPWGVLEIKEERNWKGLKKPYPAKIEECRACKLCEWYCPDFAIQVIVDDEEEKRVLDAEENYEKPWLARIERRNKIIQEGVWWLED